MLKMSKYLSVENLEMSDQIRASESENEMDYRSNA